MVIENKISILPLKSTIQPDNDGTAVGQRKENQIALENGAAEKPPRHRRLVNVHKPDNVAEVALVDDAEGKEDGEEGRSVAAVLLH